jgi:hypothetical protein
MQVVCELVFVMDEMMMMMVLMVVLWNEAAEERRAVFAGRMMPNFHDEELKKHSRIWDEYW